MSPHNTVILGCRDLHRAAEAQRSIIEATGNSRVRAMQLDLASMSSVREFVARFAGEVDGSIDALVCNAGVSRGPALTVDGVDTVFETNHLAHFLLTLSLLSRMSSERPSDLGLERHAPAARTEADLAGRRGGGTSEFSRGGEP
jgi:NAD(P)-dependent dehydrogenase (short-subunit alcohol dehydrogenase family)